MRKIKGKRINMGKNKKTLREALEDAAQFVEEGQTRLALIYEAFERKRDDDLDYMSFQAELSTVVDKLRCVRVPKKTPIIGVSPEEDGEEYEAAFADDARDKYDEYVAIYEETQNAFAKEILLDLERVRSILTLHAYDDSQELAKQLGAIVDKIKAKAIR